MRTRLLVACCVLAVMQGRMVPAADDFPIDHTTAPNSQIFQAGGTFPFALSTSNTFAQFADLSLTFSLAAPTPVVIIYKVTAFCPPSSFFVTRVLVDGVEEPALRDITGTTNYFSNGGTWVRTLGAGSHTVTVQYRTVCGGNNDPSGSDHDTRKLMVIAYTGP